MKISEVENEKWDDELQAEDWFTDREEPRKAFWDMYGGMEKGDCSVISYYGVGGIGKTSLLHKLEREMDEKAEECRNDHAFFSFEGEASKEDFLFELSRKIMAKNKGVEFPLFDYALIRMLSEEGRDITKFEKKAESILGSDTVDTAVSVVNEFVPGADSIRKVANVVYKLVVSQKAKKEKESGPKASAYKHIDNSTNTTIRSELHRYFRSDLFDAFVKRERPYVFFLDGYEKLVNIVEDGDRSELVDSWMYERKHGVIMVPNTLWVIAGRELLKWDEEVLSNDDQHRVGNLSLEDTKLFFEKSGINDEQLVCDLYKLTSGTPAFLDLCKKTYFDIKTDDYMPQSKDFGKDTRDLALRYLRGMSIAQQALMTMLCYFPNTWDEKMAEEVARALNYRDYLPALSNLLRLSLFEKTYDGYRLHETFKTVIKDTDFGRKEKEKVTKTIFLYSKNQLLSSNESEPRMKNLRIFCDYLPYGKGMISADELMTIKRILYAEKEMLADFLSCEELSGKMISFAKESGFSAEVVLSLLNLQAFNCYYLGWYKKGYERSRENYEYAIKNLSEDNPEVLASLFNLASSTNDVGDEETSFKLYEKCLSARLRILGEKNADTLKTMNGFAFRYRNMGKVEEALEMFKRCYRLRCEVLGETHQETLRTLNNIGSCYTKLGDKEEAYRISKKCYEQRIEKLGEEHFDTLHSINAMGESSLNIGRYEEALFWYEKCYENGKEYYADSPVVLASMEGMAWVFEAMGDLEKALIFYEKCYEGRKEIMGEEHRLTRRCKEKIEALKKKV